MAAVRGSRLWIDASTLGKGRAQLWQHRDVQRLRAGDRGDGRLCMPPKSGGVLYIHTVSGRHGNHIYSSDVAEHVARLMGGPLSLRTIWPHDAMSAVWLAGVDVELRDDYRFHDRVGRGTVQGNCTDESLMIHPLHDTVRRASVDACGCLACGTGVCPRCRVGGIG